jgi:hypothetical protein
MPPSQPRKVEVESTPSARPRDAAIRKAANDNRGPIITYRAANDAYSSYPSISDEFNQSYDQAGFQPSVGGIIDYGSKNGHNNTLSSKAQTDPYGKVGDDYAHLRRANVQHFDEHGKKTNVSRVKSNNYESTSPFRKTTTTKVMPGSKSFNPKKALMKKLPGGVGEGTLGTIADKAFATEAVIMVAPAAATVWFAFQLPLALTSLAALGIAAGLDYVKKEFESTTVGSTISWVAGVIYDSFDSVSTALWGFDLNSFSPTTFFILTDGLVMLIGWFTILIIGFVLLFFGLSPVFGKGSGAKISALIAALVFYALPVFNLFPWFALWVLAVWLYPTEE